jgi:hypothetical protein
MSPVKPIVPGGPVAATAPMTPPAPGGVPLKPTSATSMTPVSGNPKTGTSIVKSAPPKETARITVKPNLPTAVRAGGNMPVAKAGAVAVPAAVAAAVVAAKAGEKPSSKPATTIVKPGSAVTVKGPTVKPSAKPVSATSATTAASPAVYQEEGSTTLTTVLAGVLAVVTWGTAGVLIASYLNYI